MEFPAPISPLNTKVTVLVSVVLTAAFLIAQHLHSGLGFCLCFLLSLAWWALSAGALPFTHLRIPL